MVYFTSMPLFIFTLLSIFLSVVIHEISHGYAAYGLGDKTAKDAGRLTLNPLPHIDTIGTLIVPAFLILTNSSFLFGWAKPVPYNPYNLRGGRYGEAFVAAAGSLSNFAIALILGFSSSFLESGPVLELIYIIVFINIILGLFNLIPLPPLDGSKVLLALLPGKIEHWYRTHIIETVERLGILSFFLIVFLFIFLLADPFFNFAGYLTQLVIIS